MTNKKFWTTIKSFLTTNGNDFIITEHGGELISNGKELVEFFNEIYVNKVEISSGKKPSSIGDSDNLSSDVVNVKRIVNIYSSYPSILTIKSQ